MECENNIYHCTKPATEQVAAFKTSQLPPLKLRLCAEDSSILCAVLAKRQRDFERVSLLTGESVKHRHEGFTRTARVGRGKAK